MSAKIILITGSSSGIGRETAFRFAREGWRVILTYHRGRTRGERAAAKCRALGAPQALLVPLDVRDRASIGAARNRVARAFGKIDVLVNNAGVGVIRPFRKQTDGEVERQVRTNFLGLIDVTHAFLPRVKSTVIAIASAAGEEAYPGMAPYCGTKFGVRGFIQALARENPAMRIGCVNPDQTATHLSGYAGRPASEAAEVVYRTVTGAAKMNATFDVNVWEALK
jgi:NAD(P)-dependent dehydrogenase (short-subunit alcohol dehydrogenase family)